VGTDVQLDRLGPVEKIADGGQGCVFRLPMRPGLLLKRYHPGVPVSQTSLGLLIGHPARMRPADRSVITESTAWPSHRVFDAGRCVGLLMREAPSRFASAIAGRERLLELQFLLYPKRPMWSELLLPTVEERRELAMRYMFLLHTLHRNDLVVGDVSMRNLLWTLEGGPGVFAIDCDGFRVSGNRPAVRQAETSGWRDPSVGRRTATFDSDRYKLALLVLRVLLADHTVTPESIAESPESREELGTAIAELAEQALSPGERPAAKRWLDALGDRRTGAKPRLRLSC
jgi:DNA-binding helix-hairpin-helix protein with protein kinase domain